MRKTDLVTKLLIHNNVCRTAPAKPGWSNRQMYAAGVKSMKWDEKVQNNILHDILKKQNMRVNRIYYNT